MSMRPVQRSDQRTPQRVVLRTTMNRFDLDISKIPEGMTYEWKRKSIMGMEDIESQVNYEANYWTPVPPERHPELMGTRQTQARDIVRGGLMLMERPKEISQQAREIDQLEARRQVSNQMQRLFQTGHRADPRGIKTEYMEASDRVIPADPA